MQNVLNRASSKLPAWAYPIIAGGIVFCVYLLTLSRWYSGDDLRWMLMTRGWVQDKSALSANRAAYLAGVDPATRWAPQPRYFLELPTASPIYALGGAAWSDNAVLPMETARAVGGAIGVVFFFLALSKFLPRGWSLALSMGLAFSCAWWYYSVHPDYPIFSCAFTSILSYQLASLLYSGGSAPPNRAALAMGVVSAFAMLYLLTGALMIPVVILALGLCFSRGQAWRAVLAYLAGLGATLAVVCIAIWVMDVGAPPVWAALFNNARYAGNPSLGVSPLDIPKAVYGFSRALLTYPPLNHADPSDYWPQAGLPERIAFVAWQGFAILIAIAPFFILARLRHKLGQHQKTTLVLLVWFAIQVAFQIYWEPTYIKWWGSALLCWWGLMALLVAMMPAAQARGRAARVAICAVIIFVAGANLFGEFLPNAKPAETRMTALSSALGAASGPNDLFITSQDVLFDFHLLYFAQRRAIAYAPPAPASEFVVSLARETLKQKGKIYLCNFDAQSLAIFQKSAFFSSARPQRVMQNLLPPDFAVYELSGLVE